MFMKIEALNWRLEINTLIYANYTMKVNVFLLWELRNSTSEWTCITEWSMLMLTASVYFNFHRFKKMVKVTKEWKLKNSNTVLAKWKVAEKTWKLFHCQWLKNKNHHSDDFRTRKLNWHVGVQPFFQKNEFVKNMEGTAKCQINFFQTDVCKVLLVIVEHAASN